MSKILTSLEYFMGRINKLNEILLAFYVSNCWHILNWICNEKKRIKCLRYFDYSRSRFSQILSPIVIFGLCRAWSFCCFFFLNIDDDLIYEKTKQRWIFVVRLIYFSASCAPLSPSLSLSFRFVSLFSLRVIHGCCLAHWGGNCGMGRSGPLLT